MAAFELRCAARAATTADSSAGTLAPLGCSISLVFKLSGPVYMKGAAASTGGLAAVEAFELRWAARAAATAGSSAGTLAPLGWVSRLAADTATQAARTRNFMLTVWLVSEI